MDNIKKQNQQGNVPADTPTEESESTVQYTHLIAEHAFLGQYPLSSILEGIGNQFHDYINIEDTKNYVDIFFDQLHVSYDKVRLNDGEEHPTEIKEVLDGIYRLFISVIDVFFKTRLTLSIIPIEDENINDPDVEFIIRRLYEFFILNAKTNFKVVIATDVMSLLKDITDDDDEYFRVLQASMERYSPLVTTVTSTQFLQYRGDQEVYDMFENGKVTGNFLRKYSPKLYQNEEFEVELINYITMVHQFKQDISIVK